MAHGRRASRPDAREEAMIRQLNSTIGTSVVIVTFHVAAFVFVVLALSWIWTVLTGVLLGVSAVFFVHENQGGRM